MKRKKEKSDYKWIKPTILAVCERGRKERKMEKLQKLYDAEINFKIQCFWDNGFEWFLGDDLNGYAESGNADTVIDAVGKLFESAKKRYPI